MAQTIYLIRHAKTEWNEQKRLQGRGDSPLLQSSYYDVLRMNNWIKNIKFDSFFYSPLPRVVNTLEQLGDLVTKRICHNDLLSEIDFGDYEGYESSSYEVLNFKLKRDKWNTPWPNGESYSDVNDRVNQFLDYTRGFEVVGILAHETINKLFLYNIMGFSREKTYSIKQPNNVVFKITVDFDPMHYTRNLEEIVI